jgi:hypothetical protein
MLECCPFFFNVHLHEALYLWHFHQMMLLVHRIILYFFEYKVGLAKKSNLKLIPRILGKS